MNQLNMRTKLSTTILILVTALVVFITLFYRGAFTQPSSDFVNIFVGAKSLQAGENTLYDVKTQREKYELLQTDEIFVPYQGTPLKAAVLFTLRNFPLKIASEIWFVTGVLLLLINAFIIGKKNLNTTLLFFLCSILFYPIFDSLRIGHIGLILLTIINIFYLSNKNENPIFAGIISGFLIIEPTFLTLVPFMTMLVKTKHKLKVYLINISLSILVLIGINIILYGSKSIITDYSSFLEGLRSQGFSQQAIPEFGFTAVIKEYVGTSEMQAYFYDGIAIAAAIIFLNLLRSNFENIEKEILVIISAGLVFTIHSPIYALVMLLPPLFIYTRNKINDGEIKAAIYGALLYFAPLLALPILGKYNLNSTLTNFLLLTIPLYLITNDQKRNQEHLQDKAEKQDTASAIFR